mmetsp:Transcript_8159/g.17481  ORF Transcript_8159/g.17481 Transcript_8159/m.17481 type:complete len:259 (-) Transcript_8159:737-1513(-)
MRCALLTTSAPGLQPVHPATSCFHAVHPAYLQAYITTATALATQPKPPLSDTPSHPQGFSFELPQPRGFESFQSSHALCRATSSSLSSSSSRSACARRADSASASAFCRRAASSISIRACCSRVMVGKLWLGRNTPCRRASRWALPPAAAAAAAEPRLPATRSSSAITASRCIRVSACRAAASAAARSRVAGPAAAAETAAATACRSSCSSSASSARCSSALRAAASSRSLYSRLSSSSSRPAGPPSGPSSPACSSLP